MAQKVEAIIRSEIIELSDAITRPADTTQYTAGDVIAEVTNNDHYTFVDDGITDAIYGYITGARLDSSANQATKLAGELWLFAVDIAEVADNGVYAPTDAEMLTRIGVIDFSAALWKVGTSTSGAGGNACCDIELDVPIQFKSTGTLYGQLVARNAYTPVASEVFTVALKIVRTQ